jgi:hypothetical protein
VAHNLLCVSDMYHNNQINSMQQTHGIETVPHITNHQMILDALSHHTRSSIRALQTFLGIAILAGSCTLPITSLIFAPELFDQGAVVRAKVDEQLTAATEILGAIAGNLLGKTTKSPEAGQKPDTTGTM